MKIIGVILLTIYIGESLRLGKLLIFDSLCPFVLVGFFRIIYILQFFNEGVSYVDGVVLDSSSRYYIQKTLLFYKILRLVLGFLGSI